MDCFDVLLFGPLFYAPQAFWRAVQWLFPGRRAFGVAAMPWLVCGVLWLVAPYWFDATAYYLVSSLKDHLSVLPVGSSSGGDEYLTRVARRLATAALTLMATTCGVSTVAFGPLHLGWAALDKPKNKMAGQSHGSADWGTARDAERTGRLVSQGRAGGLMLGRTTDRCSRRTDPRYRVTRHVLTCAPTGAGKGIGCVIPNLLAYPGAVVCLDVKGENYAVTADARRRMGQEVFCLDPFGITGEESHSLNWLDALNLYDESCVSDAATLAETLVVRGAEGDSYWDDAAVHLLQGLLLHVTSLPSHERHMGTLRSLLTLQDAQLMQAMQDIGANTSLAYGIPSRAAWRFVGKADRERSAVLSTALRHTAFLDDPRIARALRTTQIDFASLKIRPATVYIVLPPDKLVAYSRFARATLGLAMHAMMHTPGRPVHDVLFLLDEFAQLGRFAAIEQNISILRGYGATLWLLVQDLSQLRGVYTKWESFLANTALQAFGTQDMQTARYLLDMLGQSTQHVRSQNRGSSLGPDGRASNNRNEGESAHGRALLTADEVRRLSEDHVLVFEQGQLPQRLRRLDYRTDVETKRQATSNPMHVQLNAG
jgi:type IV secretion system protein VirD4